MCVQATVLFEQHHILSSADLELQRIGAIGEAEYGRLAVCASTPLICHGRAPPLPPLDGASVLPWCSTSTVDSTRVADSILKIDNASCEYDQWIVETQLCKLRNTSDTLIWRACSIRIPFVTWCFVNLIYDMVVDTHYEYKKINSRPTCYRYGIIYLHRK